ncbi:cold shock domain-containing protein [Pseudomonas sp. MWU13-2100]|uniref:cold shock domain-containing protein n=1 Tax=Pseudomonas sp. MWU13-2100 TaxID=2935075 RepID=UPI00200CFD22|nr:cold shock domain-containing protein [Pseudomonas sp. MWU13-2100]
MDKYGEERYDSARGGIGVITAHVGGRELFFHVKSATDGGPELKAGDTVSYDVVRGEDGQFYAVNLEVVESDLSETTG